MCTVENDRYQSFVEETTATKEIQWQKNPHKTMNEICVKCLEN